MTHQEKVAEFMRVVAGQEVHTTPTMRDEKTRQLQFRLMQEELLELVKAVTECDRIKIADGAVDLAYVALNAANAHGVNVVPTEGYWWIDDSIRSVSDYKLNCKHPCHVNNNLSVIYSFCSKLAVDYKFHFDRAFSEVHRSNMTKMWTDAETYSTVLPSPNIGSVIACNYNGEACTAKKISNDVRCWRVKNEAGKLIKSPTYSPADLSRFV